MKIRFPVFLVLIETPEGGFLPASSPGKGQTLALFVKREWAEEAMASLGAGGQKVKILSCDPEKLKLILTEAKKQGIEDVAVLPELQLPIQTVIEQLPAAEEPN